MSGFFIFCDEFLRAASPRLEFFLVLGCSRFLHFDFLPSFSSCLRASVSPWWVPLCRRIVAYFSNAITLIAIAGCLLSGASAQDSRIPGLQEEISRQMAGKSGAVVVIGAASGKVLAQWHLHVAGQRLELPGSTVKPFVLMELLEKARINPEQHLACRRPLYVGGKRMDCSHPPGITSLDAPDAIAYSCNTYFSTVATRLDPGELAEVYKHVGFTSPTGLIENEAVGRTSVPADQGQLQLQALGEWGIETTPLELLAAYRTLARLKLNGQDHGVAAPVFDGLERAVKYGVARGAQPTGTTAAGKTGTAAGLKTPITHGFFVGYAPAEKPEIVILVYLERGRGMDAAVVASPVITAWWKNK